MNVTQTPDAVFDRPVAEILPQLEGASPTGENGRVGGELVFWGYELADGRPVYLFGCARLENVDCDERLLSICPDNNKTTLLNALQNSGKVMRRRCRSVSVAPPGESRPGCAEAETERGLMVGVVSCG